MIARIPLPALSIVTTGFAIFSMFFGSGNLIFPIELGQRTGANVAYGYTGLLITGVICTLISLLTIILFRGNYHTFFNRLGRLPGTLLNICVLVMIGPLTGIPRAANVLHQIVCNYVPGLELSVFVLIFLGVIFFAAYRRERVMPLLGYVISPLLVILLLALVGSAVWYGAPLRVGGLAPLPSFMRGIYEGYATMDMLAAFHFAPLAITYLKRMSHRPRFGPKNVIRGALAACTITCILLFVIYIGLSYIGGQYGMIINTHNPVTLTYMVTRALLPAGMMIGLHLLFMLAIVSTALSLTTIFTDFLHDDLFDKQIHYMQALLLTLLATGCAANVGLHTILRLEKSFLYVFSPPLIVLTLCNLAYKTVRFPYVKVPVALTFAVSLISYIF